MTVFKKGERNMYIPACIEGQLLWFADRNEWPCTIIRRSLFELVGTISLDRNYWKVTNLLFVLPILFYLRKYYNFGTKKFSTCVSRRPNAREVKINSFRGRLIADRNEWPKPYTIIRRFLFELVGMMSLDRNYWQATNLSFVSAYFVSLKYT